MTFSKLYSALGPGRARAGGVRREIDQERGKGTVRGLGGGTEGKHLKYEPLLNNSVLFLYTVTEIH